jgi:membrane-associated protease RseP (regulator of RpoE activity)
MKTNPIRAHAAIALPLSGIRSLALFLVLAIAGCATVSHTTTEPSPQPLPPEETGQYETVTGREPALVADLRAAPPPAEPEIADGRNIGAEEKRLRLQSYMRIGTSRFAADDAGMREKALRQGQRVGANRLIVYPADASSTETTVAYYVRFKLPFGATFRDLRPAEMSALGTGGGVAIGTIVGDSPASRANLLTGDIVLKCDGKAIVDRTDFQNQLREKAGHPVTLTIVRNGETLQRVVRLGAMTNAG